VTLGGPETISGTTFIRYTLSQLIRNSLGANKPNRISKISVTYVFSSKSLVFTQKIARRQLGIFGDF
jgi:hypothetical protein